MRSVGKKSETKQPIEQVRCRVLPDGRMTRRDAAAYLGLATKTLAMWALSKKGPRSVKVGGRRFYFKDDLDAFIRGEVTALTNTALAHELMAVSTLPNERECARFVERSVPLDAERKVPGHD